MNKNSKKLSLYIGLMIILSGIATGLRCSACLGSLDYTYGYFTDHTLIRVANIILLIGIAVMATYALSADKVNLKTHFSSTSTFVPTGLVGVALFMLAFRQVSSALIIYKEGSGASRNMTLVLVGLSALLAIFAVIHFFLNAFITESRNDLRAFFATLSALFLAIYATYLYFTDRFAINAPNKITDQMAFLISALFLLYEARISLGRERWVSYSTFGLMASMLTAFSSVPSLVVYVVKGELVSQSIEENVLTFALFIFITSRLLLTASLEEKRENEKIAVLHEYAEVRQKEIYDEDLRYAEQYAVQISIEDLISDDDNIHLDFGEADISEEFELPEDEPETVFIAESDTDIEDAQITIAPDLFRDEDAEDGNDGEGGADADEKTDEDDTE